jgi:hypothetical protein
MTYKFSKKFFRPKKSKYGNKKITDSKNNKFDSKKEYERWLTLQILQSKGIIQGLQRQVPYILIPSYKGIQQRISYVADFVYYEKGKRIIEDVKSDITRKHPLYVVKKKLLYHFHKIQIKET